MKKKEKCIFFDECEMREMIKDFEQAVMCERVEKAPLLPGIQKYCFIYRLKKIADGGMDPQDYKASFEELERLKTKN